MRCAVHSDVDAVGYCRNCGKAMCSACVRPVRDVLYCEDCLATIMGIPSATPTSTAVATAPGFLPPPVPPRSLSSPGIAFLLGLCPGLGAVYNGEYNKALIHVVVFVTLVVGASSDVDTALMVILILSSIGFCFYMAFDAMRVARAKNLGLTPLDALESWTKNRPVGPILLIALGVLFLLNNFDWFSFHRIERFLWPLILIGVGVMMFRNRLGDRS
jgi:cell wall-active antibiotic response 4TMS protein YvqF